MFSREFCEISKSTFFTEHLCTTASEDRSNLRLGLLRSKTIGLIIQITANFRLALHLTWHLTLHLGPNQSLSGLLSIYKDDSAFRVLVNWF